MENQLKVLKKALEEGATIEIKYHSVKHEFDEKQAIEKAEEISSNLGIEYKKERGETSSWMCEKSFGSQITFSIFFKNSKEDEIRKLEQKLKELKGETA